MGDNTQQFHNRLAELMKHRETARSEKLNGVGIGMTREARLLAEGDEEIIMLDHGEIANLTAKMEEEEARKRKSSSGSEKEEVGGKRTKTEATTHVVAVNEQSNETADETKQSVDQKVDIKASDFFMKMIAHDTKDTQLKTIEGLISTLQSLKDNVSGGNERSSNASSLPRPADAAITSSSSSSMLNAQLSQATSLVSGSEAQTQQQQQSFAFAFTPSASPVIGISHPSRTLMSQETTPTIAKLPETSIAAATSSAVNTLVCSLQPTVSSSSSLDPNPSSLVSALQIQSPVINNNTFHKMPALAAAPSIYSPQQQQQQQKMIPPPKPTPALQSPIMMQGASLTSQEIQMRNQLALQNAAMQMQQQNALRMQQAQQVQLQQQVAAVQQQQQNVQAQQMMQAAASNNKPFEELSRQQLQQLVLDGIHRVHNGRATNEQVLAILAHPYLTVNGKLIQNPFFEPSPSQAPPQSAMTLPVGLQPSPQLQQLPMTAQPIAPQSTITLQQAQQMQLPQGIQTIPIMAHNGMSVNPMQSGIFANGLVQNGINGINGLVQAQLPQQLQQNPMQVQAGGIVQAQQQQPKPVTSTTLMFPPTSQPQQNRASTQQQNNQHLTNGGISSGAAVAGATATRDAQAQGQRQGKRRRRQDQQMKESNANGKRRRRRRGLVVEEAAMKSSQPIAQQLQQSAIHQLQLPAECLAVANSHGPLPFIHTQIPLGTRLMMGCTQQQIAATQQQQMQTAIPPKQSPQIISLPPGYQLQQSPASQLAAISAAHLQPTPPQIISLSMPSVQPTLPAAVSVPTPVPALSQLPTPLTVTRPSPLQSSLAPTSSSIVMSSPLLHSQLMSNPTEVEKHVPSPLQVTTARSLPPTNKMPSQTVCSVKEKKSSFPVVEVTEARPCNEWSVVTIPLPTVLHAQCKCFDDEVYY